MLVPATSTSITPQAHKTPHLSCKFTTIAGGSAANHTSITSDSRVDKLAIIAPKSFVGGGLVCRYLPRARPM